MTGRCCVAVGVSNDDYQAKAVKTMTANISNELRKEVYRRDGYRCALCSSGYPLQIHHAIPRGKGGSDFIENLVTLCSTCHAQVHGYIPLECDYMDAEDLNQAICEYLADYYAEDGGWYPFK